MEVLGRIATSVSVAAPWGPRAALAWRAAPACGTPLAISSSAHTVKVLKVLKHDNVGVLCTFGDTFDRLDDGVAQFDIGLPSTESRGHHERESKRRPWLMFRIKCRPTHLVNEIPALHAGGDKGLRVLDQLLYWE